MHWYDWVALLVVLAGTIVQIVRGSRAGFGLTLFEAAAVVAAAVAAVGLSGGLANLIRVNQGVVLLVLFLAFAVITFMVARLLFGLTGWSFQSYDGAYSILFGLVLGWTVAYIFLRVAVASQGANSELAKNIATSPVAREILQFRTWNALMRLFFTARQGPDFE